MQIKFSIIIPTFNLVEFLKTCIDSVMKYTTSYEIIVVDNGSTDSTPFYITHLSQTLKSFRFVSLSENKGFAYAVNAGLSHSKGKWKILLNNDTIVTPNWLENMQATLHYAQHINDMPEILAVGPVTNNAGGLQLIETDEYKIEELPESAICHRKEHLREFRLTQWLSGFCFMFSEKIYNDIGPLDTRFHLGGFEDTDYCRRLTHAGYKMIIDDSTYIHHYGQQTLFGIPDYKNTTLLSNNLLYMEKYFSDKKRKLIVILRVHNGGEYIDSFLSGIDKFCDGLLVVLDRCTDSTKFKISKFPKTLHYKEFNTVLDEARDRQYLIDKLHTYKADWGISLDVDEVIESSFTYEVSHKLMNPPDPGINFYLFNVMTMFNHQDYYMSHSVWGHMRGGRMFRVLPNQKIYSNYASGLHCSHCPSYCPSNTVHLRYRIKHYGYDSEGKRTSKYNFYSSIDKHPDLVMVGPQGYKHLVSSKVDLIKYKENNTISLAILYNGEASQLFYLLFNHYYLFDEIVILSSVPADNGFKFAELFNAKIYTTSFKNDFSQLRNDLKSLCTMDWILMLDPDESINPADLHNLPRLLEGDFDGYLSLVYNYQPDNNVLFSDNVRLVKNIKEIYWTHLVHETITESFHKNSLIIGPSHFTIHHYGFLVPKNKHKFKSQLYVKLLKKEINKYPKVPINYFHIAFHYFDNEKEDLGLSYLIKTLSLDPNLFLASKELAIRYLDRALHYFEICTGTMPRGHYHYGWVKGVYEYLLKSREIK